MSKQVDERVVTMQFDNRQFEDNVKTSMSTIDKLKKALNFEKAGEGLEKVKDSINLNKINITGLSGAIDQVNAKFSALQVIGVTALSNITNQAMSMSKKMISALTINPVKDGLKEYETQMNAVQTILANTQKEGTNVKIVNKALDELNAYADKTIYNFTEMTRNIGTFTAAGVKLDTSVSAIKGIANLAAISGSTSQQASTAMYQLSQALASGTVKLMDWNSVVNAGMGGQVFQDALENMKDVSLKAVGAMALMGLVVAELAGVLFVIQKLDINPSMNTVLALSTLLIAMSASLAIVAVVGTACPGAIAGILDLLAFITAVGLITAGIGALNEACQGDLATFVNSSIPILQDMGEGIGNFVGGLVGGVVAGAIDSLAGIGTTLSTFMDNLQPFIAKVSAIEPDSMAGGEALAKMLLTLTAANLISGLSRFLGVKDLGNLGTQMENFADSICKFDQKLKDHGGIDKNLVEQAGYAGETMAKLQKGLYGTGGLKQGILGEKDLSDFQLNRLKRRKRDRFRHEEQVK